MARGFRGARFWDDVLDALAAPDRRLLDTLAAEQDPALAEAYAEWGRDAPYALLTIITLLAARDRAAAAAITGAYIRWLGEDSEHVRALSRTFRFYPELLNRFVLTLEREDLADLEERLDVPIGNPEVAAARGHPVREADLAAPR